MTIKKRWSSKTPRFWKKVQRVSITAGVVAGTLISAPLSLPVALISGLTYIVAISTTIATISQLTVEK